MIDSLIVKLPQQTFMPEIYQNTFAGRACLDPLGELKRSPDRPSRN